MRGWWRNGSRALLGVMVLLLSQAQFTGRSVDAQCRGPEWAARIAIVYPDGGLANLANSTRVNISVWPAGPVRCDQCPTNVTLWTARDNEPMVPVATADQGQLLLRRDGDHDFPTLEFNNIAADLRGGHQYNFVAGPFVLYNPVWVHGVDPRTYNPHPVVPTGFAEGVPGQTPALQRLDSRIQVVWPHDGKGNPMPADRARYVNIAVEIFEHGTLKAVRDFWPQGIILYGAKGNEPFKPLIRIDEKSRALDQAVKTSYAVAGQEFPRWLFNNIPVDPAQQYHFMVYLNGPNPGGPTPDAGAAQCFPSIWTHAADARTYLPDPLPPKYGLHFDDTAAALGCAAP